MALLLLSAKILLALVFAAAGAGKLIDRTRTRNTVADFGVPHWLARPIGSLLPFAELAVATLLLPVRSAWWGGIGALALLLAFTAIIVMNLVQGRNPDCHCFGQIRSRPIGWSTVVRNGVLALCAAFVVLTGPAVPVSAGDLVAGLAPWQAVALVATAALVVAFIGQTWLIFHLFKQHGRLLLRLDELEKRLGGPAAAHPAAGQHSQGLPIGAPAPSFELPTASGQLVSLNALHGDKKPALLIFSDPKCAPCTALLPDIAKWQRDYADKVQITLVSRGAEKANRAKAKQHGVRDLLLQTDGEVAALYGATGTPSAVLIRIDGSIGSRVVSGPDAIKNLVSVAAGVGAKTNGNGHGKLLPIAMPSYAGLPIGDKAPAVSLPDVYGRMISFSDFKGRRTLVLFWNPGCSFCQRMLPDLKGWETNRPRNAPDLLVVSTGTREANKEMGLRSPVLLDPASGVARQFRGGATPSAVLIDDEGRIASELAVGLPNVLALAGITNARAYSAGIAGRG
jgi:peroxiredoxin